MAVRGTLAHRLRLLRRRRPGPKMRAPVDSQHERIWQALLKIGTRTFTVTGLSREIRVPYGTVQEYVRALARSGHLSVAEPSYHYQGGCTPHVYRVARMLGPLVPLIRHTHPGRPIYDPNGEIHERYPIHRPDDRQINWLRSLSDLFSLSPANAFADQPAFTWIEAASRDVDEYHPLCHAMIELVFDAMTEQVGKNTFATSLYNIYRMGEDRIFLEADYDSFAIQRVIVDGMISYILGAESPEFAEEVIWFHRGVKGFGRGWLRSRLLERSYMEALR